MALDGSTEATLEALVRPEGEDEETRGMEGKSEGWDTVERTRRRGDGEGGRKGEREEEERRVEGGG